MAENRSVKAGWLSAMVLAAAAGGASPASAEDPRSQASRSGDLEVQVTIDDAESSGTALANVRIRATPEEIFDIVTSCPEALKIVPGLLECEVLETAADGSWQRIRHVLDYSWYVPKLTYELRADYHRPDSSQVERVAGDLRSMHASWTLTRAGEETVAHYSMELTPGFWVPHWVIRGALKRDLPMMLRALRSRAESIHRDRKP